MHDPVLESHHLVCEKPQTRRGIERRLALLLSATELFLEKGYDAVSLDDIVNHAGGSKTSIKDICIAFQPEQTSLKDYLIQTLIRFYKHIIQPEHIAFLRLVIEQTQCNATLSQYLYEKCALDVQNTIAQALLISHQSGEITCTSPDHSSLMYFGILRDIEWRMIMGMPLPPNETEVIDYINYCVDIFLKGHHKV
ncbi:TetR/AcrR family transcriptional regulator [Acinetobacter baumannii]|nr:TetR/AcrR family transcriptional regulator [Acinetobacter baumannii]EKU0433817.1 TetR/AcrR family transcriptional regulator [Acinetobacter baumannii]EKU0690951.1 TetR/AcrR family transcriptional regulator [Acinetobacter baumannii]EKU2673196.1 TetR/AcrR family transcriptional regulator [Acinetobacter baumannii]EKU3830495.1 TetR/AcrR family transcriptional regulator [Acinetobacter baumannii]